MKQSMMPIRVRAILPRVILMACAMAQTVIGQAQAQQAMLPIALGEAFQADFYRRDLVTFNEVLILDDAQRPVLETLFADYEADFRTAAEKARAELDVLLPLATMDDEARRVREEQIQDKVRELMELANQISQKAPAGPEGDAARKQLQERAEQIRAEIDAINSRPPEGEQLLAALVGAQPILERWMIEKAALRTAFMTDVQAVLSDGQVARVPALERRLRRDKTLPRGRLSGESVNLLQLLKESSVPPTAMESLDAEVTAYELRLDEALMRRNEHLEASSREWLKVMQSKDAARAGALADEQMRLRVAVREVNDQASDAFAAKLPPELAASFLNEARLRGYPRVYRMTQPQRLLTAAQEAPDLKLEVAGLLETLELQYLAELKTANERLIVALKRAEPDELKDRLVRVAVGGQEDPIQSVVELDELFDSRVELGKRYNQTLESMLTPQQLQRLPRGEGPAEPE
jgi:uncharacterized protein YihD (DUF1040 family)